MNFPGSEPTAPKSRHKLKYISVYRRCNDNCRCSLRHFGKLDLAHLFDDRYSLC